MSEWDVIIVGAGQAGCAAAWDLAAAGARVLILDRRRRRLKPCAGGVTEKALNRYRFPIDAVVREAVDALDVSYRARGPRRLDSGKPFCAMTVRSELDAFCLQQALEKGATLCRIGELEALRQTAGRVELVDSDGRRFTADAVIAADGVHSRVRRLLGSGPTAGAVAVEATVPRSVIRRWPAMTLDFGVIRQGYGWLFPKGDHVNIGLYQRANLSGISRSTLKQYCERQLGVREVHGVAGFPLGTRCQSRQLTQGRVFFAGDAAGCTEVLLGEGIYGALLSGQLAAHALGCENAETVYRRSLAPWSEELAWVQGLAQGFYRTLPVSAAMLKWPLDAELVDGYAAGLTLEGCVRRWRGGKQGRREGLSMN